MLITALLLATAVAAAPDLQGRYSGEWKSNSSGQGGAFRLNLNPGANGETRPLHSSAWTQAPGPSSSAWYRAVVPGTVLTTLVANHVYPDPLYGGYSMAQDAGVGVAGIGPKQDPNAPTAWMLYIGTDDADALAQRVTDNGGTVVAAPFDVGDQGRMAVFQDPAGAFFSTWQAAGPRGFVSHQTGAFDWGELNARGVESVLPFYQKVFGWDLTAQAIKGIDEGWIVAVVQQDPYQEGQAGVETILKIKKGEKVEPSIDIPVTIVTKENVDKYRSMFK